MDSQDELDSALSGHFARQLDPHVGRSRAAFEAMLADEARAAERGAERGAAGAAAQRRRMQIRRRIVIGSAGLIAASVAIAWGVMTLRPSSDEHRTGGDRRIARSDGPSQAIPPSPVSPAMLATPASAPAAETTGPQDLERLVSWQTVDDGMDVIDQTPVRKLRREEVEEVQWFDPETKGTVRMTIPREQVVLVEMKRF